MSAETGKLNQFTKGLQRLEAGLTDVIGADFECFITSHYESDLLGLFMSQEANITRSSFLPL